MVFPVVTYGCESTIKKVGSWKKWYFQTVVHSRRLLSVPLTARRSNQLILKEIRPNRSYPFIGRTDAEAEAPILWLPDVKSQLIGKDPDAGKDWRQEEKRETEDEMVGWHHWLNGHEFEQTLGDSGGQMSLACCNPWGSKELDTTYWLNKSDNNINNNIILLVIVYYVSEPWSFYQSFQGPQVAQMVKNLPAVQETWVQSLSWEDPLEKGTATNSSILTLRIPWTV